MRQVPEYLILKGYTRPILSGGGQDSLLTREERLGRPVKEGIGDREVCVGTSQETTQEPP